MPASRSGRMGQRARTSAVCGVAVDISKINKDDCASCHKTGSPKPKIVGDETDYKIVMKYVDKDKPEEEDGYLWWACGGPGNHELWKKGGTAYNLFLKWVEQGALEN